MLIMWVGHSCFQIKTAAGIYIVTDPYESGSYNGTVAYDPPDVEADIVTVSHAHFDHAWTQGFPKATCIAAEGAHHVLDVGIEGFPSFHDKSQGRIRGRNIIFVFTVDGFRIAHFGDIGTLDIPYAQLSGIDVAMIPIGGGTTINAHDASEMVEKLSPRVILPMHYKTDRLDFDIAGVEPFLEHKPRVTMLNSLTITPETIQSYNQDIIVLTHQR